MELVVVVVLLLLSVPFLLGMGLGFALGRRSARREMQRERTAQPQAPLVSDLSRTRPAWQRTGPESPPAPHSDSAVPPRVRSGEQVPDPSQKTTSWQDSTDRPSPQAQTEADPAGRARQEPEAAPWQSIKERWQAQSAQDQATPGSESPNQGPPEGLRPPSPQPTGPGPQTGWGSPARGLGAPQPPDAAQPDKRGTPRSPADERRTINVALYIGGLVLTAAALAFVAATQNPVVTAAALIAAYVVFAVTGLALAVRIPLLKPAGLALFGTSLALLAVAAIPVNEAFIRNGYITWLLVSLIGVLGYGFACVHLDSRVPGYLVIPFFYSTVFSSTAVLQ
ncbi:hypothetical protein [Nesterenkonia flava]|uniref:Uncharacterized protein n=1 Tax=Nesterenkonia flava TaxID=469799 RepID=A0ABU1FUV3_9MICC|nr:hypothetical protein [Nesterenkonia flava]MDR5712445.1 hypothetical protein [Nesterenkonia flava]